jgi:hypothetical protein
MQKDGLVPNLGETHERHPERPLFPARVRHCRGGDAAMKIDVSVTIGRDSNDVINLRFVDEASRVVFLDVEMTPNDFAQCLTGLSYVKAKGEVRGLEYVGKIKVQEHRSIVCPLNTYDRGELEEWLIVNGAEEGWFVYPYLGSQSSISYRNDKKILNYSVHKYVDTE